MKVLQIVSLIAFIAIISACSSGSNYDRSEEAEARKLYKGEKIGFITEQMNFSEEEAEKFWPVHKAYRDKMDELWHEQKRFLIQNAKDGKSENATEAVEALIKFERNKADYQQEYVDQLREFLDDDQILKLFYTEYQFKHFMLNRMRGRHGHKEGRGRRMGRGGGRMENPPQPIGLY